MTTQNPNTNNQLPQPSPDLLPPPIGLAPPVLFDPVPPQSQEAPRPAGGVLPPPTALPQVEEVSETAEDLAVSPYLAKLEKNANPDFLLGLADEIDALEEAYESLAERNADAIIPSQYLDRLKTKKSELLGRFSALAQEKLSGLVSRVGATAESIDRAHYADHDPDEAGERVEAIKPVLKKNIQEIFEQVLNEGLPYAETIIDQATSSYTDVEGFEEKVTSLAESFLAQVDKKRKTSNGELIGADDALNVVTEQSARFKPLKVLSPMEKRKKDNDEASAEAKKALSQLTERLEKDQKLLGAKKSEELSKWLLEQLPEPVNTEVATQQLAALTDRVVAEVSRRFEDKAYQEQIRKTFIVPALVERGLTERKRGVPQGAVETQRPQTEPANMVATWLPKLLESFDYTNIEEISAHIGRYLSAGGKPELLEAAYRATAVAPQDKKLAVIKGLLFIPEK